MKNDLIIVLLYLYYCMFIIICFSLLTIYGILIGCYHYWFASIPIFKAPENIANHLSFTIIIPARNEEDNIGKCIDSILRQTYPTHLYEIIVVDDYSTDRTVDIVKSFSNKNIHLLSLKDLLPKKPINSYKKKAIELAIQQAKNNWIVTTDADCTVLPNWLQIIAAYQQQTNARFIAAPVKYSVDKSFLSIFQALDFLSLQGITAASAYKGFHAMCNGANLAYEKNIFLEVNGFAGVDHIASGDDMLLMHKIYTCYPKQVKYLLSADTIVTTAPMPTWKMFFNQRIRWASKADKYNDKRIIVVLAFVYLINLLFPILLIAGIWNKIYLISTLIFLGVKTIVEIPFVWRVAKFFNQSSITIYFPLAQPIHIFYTLIAGWLGKFGKYSWKERKVR